MLLLGRSLEVVQLQTKHFSFPISPSHIAKRFPTPTKNWFRLEREKKEKEKKALSSHVIKLE